jgi:hypothetical protein
MQANLLTLRAAFNFGLGFDVITITTPLSGSTPFTLYSVNFTNV